ncbi:MAG: hypothetical protein M3N38_04180 [Pseudomonadota bacterium]|nr:hypothetical protein [Pseudomonadota bacterium]
MNGWCGSCSRWPWQWTDPSEPETFDRGRQSAIPVIVERNAFMNCLVRSATVVSTLALLSLGTAGLAGAQSYESGEDGCTDPQGCSNERMQRSDDDGEENSGKRRNQVSQDDDEDQASEQQSRRKRRMLDDDNEGQVADEKWVKPKKQAQSDWQFNSRKHERRRNRDNRFRFEFGGYWYPEPYWYGYGYNVSYGISCRDGRDIVEDRGFRRVRVLECQGRTFTYLGWRRGDTYRILVNSRNGRIVGMRHT